MQAQAARRSIAHAPASQPSASLVLTSRVSRSRDSRSRDSRRRDLKNQVLRNRALINHVSTNQNSIGPDSTAQVQTVRALTRALEHPIAPAQVRRGLRAHRARKAASLVRSRQAAACPEQTARDRAASPSSRAERAVSNPGRVAFQKRDPRVAASKANRAAQNAAAHGPAARSAVRNADLFAVFCRDETRYGFGSVSRMNSAR